MQFEDREIIVQKEKLLDYLLSTTHLVGRSKAKFFRGLGFDEKSTELLRNCLIEIARSGNVKESCVSSYGTKHVIDGMLDTPSGKKVTIRTVWIELQNRVLQFVTGYPAKK